MDLHDGNEGSVQVVALGLPGVEDVHRVGAAGNGEDGLEREGRGKVRLSPQLISHLRSYLTWHEEKKA